MADSSDTQDPDTEYLPSDENPTDDKSSVPSIPDDRGGESDEGLSDIDHPEPDDGPREDDPRQESDEESLSDTDSTPDAFWDVEQPADWEDPAPPDDADDDRRPVSRAALVNVEIQPSSQELRETVADNEQRTADPEDAGTAPFAEAYSQGFLRLLLAVVTELRERDHSVVRGYDEIKFVNDCVPILAATPPLILQHIVAGNLPKAIAENEGGLQEQMEYNAYLANTKLGKNRHCQPAIYVHYLADEAGDSPTTAELVRIVRILRRYAETNQGKISYRDRVKACAYDRCGTPKWTDEHTNRGLRKFLAPDHTRSAGKIGEPTAGRLRTLHRFCDALERRLRTLPPGARFPQPLSEVGFTSRGDRRLKEHAKYRGNWLMNLVRAVCYVEYPRYETRGWFISLCFKAEHITFSEILWTELANSKVETGSGFNSWNAGMHSPNRVDIDYTAWATYARMALERTALRATLASETERVRRENHERTRALARRLAQETFEQRERQRQIDRDAQQAVERRATAEALATTIVVMRTTRQRLEHAIELMEAEIAAYAADNAPDAGSLQGPQ